MASISTYLQKILSAVYGEEVRGSIHDALAAMNVESSNAIQFASTAKDSAQKSAATATQKAAEASASAGAAKTSETNSKTSETNAKNSETAAVQKAKEAASAANAAKVSELAAADSQAAVEKSAAEAEAAKISASESANEAWQSAGAAAGAASSAQSAASSASQMSSRAAASASMAEVSANQAENAAASAGASETAAASSAAATAQKASQAAGSAAAAKSSETAAKQSQTSASTSAAAAAKSAEKAEQYSGKPPKPQDGTWWIWNAGTSKYENTGIGCELEGPPGTGVQDIALTSGDHTPGTSDVYTIKLTDGTSRTIPVYNGRNGIGAGNVLGITFDLVLPASGWADGVITVSDSHLLASAKYKYFLDVGEANRQEYLDCGIQPKDVVTNGAITFSSRKNPAADLTVNVIRLELGANGT